MASRGLVLFVFAILLVESVAVADVQTTTKIMHGTDATIEGSEPKDCTNGCQGCTPCTPVLGEADPSDPSGPYFSECGHRGHVAPESTEPSQGEIPAVAATGILKSPRKLIGSSPPICNGKCGGCVPCNRHLVGGDGGETKIQASSNADSIEFD
ncbi:hypothetical protein QJS10_CPB18g01286 [Acorus calamus]|uniref:Epidermal patterning factor-like protein n=1 Tax=Acorus calamus TaxID=4465 RepID=A0AAV9CQD3_ACOCL|nr:hypothetical protein QJS10_CPB18g01286 [Acorus calamus]